MKNYKNFNRHECFDKKMFNYFSTVKKDIVDWAMFEEVRISSFENTLFGIWDGYLYDGLIETAKELGVPEFLVYRLEKVVKHIEEFASISEEEVTNINL
jgi:hypothetical protein